MILLCIKTEVLRPIKDDDDDDDDDVDRFEHLPEPGFLRAEKLCHRIFPQYFAADDDGKHKYSAVDDDDKHKYSAADNDDNHKYKHRYSALGINILQLMMLISMNILQLMMMININILHTKKSGHFLNKQAPKAGGCAS